MKVIFIGSNPSAKSPDNSAFNPDTRSSKILKSWIENLHIDIIYENVCDFKTPNNRPLSVKEIKQSLPFLIEKIQKNNPDKIVTLGNTAEKALKIIDCYDFFAAPHPSGMNRKLNDQEYVKKMKINLNKFINEYK